MANICKIDDCTKAVHGHGWCSKHYQRWLFKKDPLKLIREPNNNRTKNPLYFSYKSMYYRCYGKTDKRTREYYKGITICDRWLGEEGMYNFFKDMGTRPEGLTLDRIDNNKGYSPENCRWADWSTQNTNKRIRKDSPRYIANQR